MLQPCLLSTCLAPAQLTVDTIPRQPAIPQGDKMISGIQNPGQAAGAWGTGLELTCLRQDFQRGSRPTYTHPAAPGWGCPWPLAPAGLSPAQHHGASAGSPAAGSACGFRGSRPLGSASPTATLCEAGRARQACVGASHCLPVRPLPAEVLPTPAGVSLLLGPRGPSRGMRGHW